jgi:sugar lactone lactonase YvrE
MKPQQLAAVVATAIVWWSLTPHASTGAEPVAVLIASGLEGASGSTVGPEGALYVTEGAAGRITRVDPDTGDKTTVASGLPPSLVGIGGAIDLAFIGRTAYVLVTLVGSDVGGGDTVGIYRVDGPNTVTVVADIGTFAIQNPPHEKPDVASGLQFAIEHYQGAFLVTDGHHNRVLRVTRHGDVSEVIAFDNTVPTGLATWGHTVYLAEAGPIPHAPEDGRILAFVPGQPFALPIASGAPLLVDVEFGRARTLYALSQGAFPVGAPPATPALPNTGSLVRANDDGTFTTVIDGLNQPTSLELIGQSAYVITLGGEVWRIDLRDHDRH